MKQDIENLPFGQMWPDDKCRLPMILSGKKITGMFAFNENGSIEKYKIKDIDI